MIDRRIAIAFPYRNVTFDFSIYEINSTDFSILDQFLNENVLKHNYF